MSFFDAHSKKAQDARIAAPAGFDLVERIGSGASGEVWRAFQRKMQRTVAVKFLAPLIEPDAEHAAKLAWRFQREIEAAAQQDHENIARVYENGVAGDRPWYAMELVEGRPLDAFAATLPLPARLALFQKVCAGVQHAHDGGVIHRDLKPANILVRDDGTPKILDFGLARFLDDTGLGATLSLDGHSLGTPMFMSPEQAAGKTGEAGVASDVYALGVIFFRLATGAWPFDERLPPLQLLAATRDAAPRAIPPEVPRDLRAIAVKALAKAKGERYPNVREFALDVERFLRGEPVAARRHTPAYVARKFLRRHWRGASIAAAILALTAAFLAAYLGQRRLAAERNARALEQARELVNAMLFDIHGKLVAIDHPELFASVAEQAAKFPWHLDEKTAGNLDLRRSQALAATARGDLLQTKGELPKAYEAHREATARLEEIARLHPREIRYQIDAAGSRITMSTIVLKLGRPGPALEDARHALAALEALPPEPTFAADLTRHRALAHRAAGAAWRARGKFIEAATAFETALAVLEKTGAPPDTLLRASLHEDLGTLLGQRGQTPAALAALAQAEAAYRQMHAAAPRDGLISIALARCLTTGAALSLDTDERRATLHLDEARDLCTAPGDSVSALAVSQQKRDLARAYRLLATRLAARDDHGGAIKIDDEAIKLLSIPQSGGRSIPDRIALYEALRHTGERWLRLGQDAEAAKVFQSALAHSRALARRHIDDARWFLTCAETELRIADLPPPPGTGTRADRLASATEQLSRFDKLTQATGTENAVHRETRQRLGRELEKLAAAK